jgi:hypothetical protein
MKDSVITVANKTATFGAGMLAGELLVKLWNAGNYTYGI